MCVCVCVCVCVCASMCVYVYVCIHVYKSTDAFSQIKELQTQLLGQIMWVIVLIHQNNYLSCHWIEIDLLRYASLMKTSYRF